MTAPTHGFTAMAALQGAPPMATYPLPVSISYVSLSTAEKTLLFLLGGFLHLCLCGRLLRGAGRFSSYLPSPRGVHTHHHHAGGNGGYHAGHGFWSSFWAGVWSWAGDYHESRQQRRRELQQLQQQQQQQQQQRESAHSLVSCLSVLGNIYWRGAWPSFVGVSDRANVTEMA